MSDLAAEKVRGWAKKGFTAKTVPSAFERVKLYFNPSISIQELRDITEKFSGFDTDFSFEKSNLDEIVSDKYSDTAAFFIYRTDHDYPRLEDHFQALVDNPKVLGITVGNGEGYKVLHQKPGFECQEVDYGRKDADECTVFGNTKVRVPASMEQHA